MIKLLAGVGAALIVAGSAAGCTSHASPSVHPTVDPARYGSPGSAHVFDVDSAGKHETRTLTLLAAQPSGSDVRLRFRDATSGQAARTVEYVAHADGSVDDPDLVIPTKRGIRLTVAGLQVPTRSALASGRRIDETRTVTVARGAEHARGTDSITLRGGATHVVVVPAGRFTALPVTIAHTVRAGARTLLRIVSVNDVVFGVGTVRVVQTVRVGTRTLHSTVKLVRYDGAAPGAL